MIVSVPAFFDKVMRHRPKFVCFVGMIVWEILRNNLVKLLRHDTIRGTEKGKNKEKNKMGLQAYKIVYESTIGMFHDHHVHDLYSCAYDVADLPEETLLFVVPCTSGRVVKYQVRSVSCLLLSLLINIICDLT